MRYMFTMNEKELVNYFNKNDDIFIQLVDKFENNFSKIPDFIKYYKNRNFTVLYSECGNFYIKANNKKKIDGIVYFLSLKISELMSLYAETYLVNEINERLSLIPKSKIDYYLMKLNKKDFREYKIENSYFKCKKVNETYFNKLKKLQKEYHLEEVYNNDIFYPYEAEMQNFKNSLAKRINYAVFYKDVKPVSKCAINSESLNSFQLGGVFTLKEFRGRGLAKFCISELLKEAFHIKENIFLYVKINNMSAINTYKRLGFKIINNTSVSYY